MYDYSAFRDSTYCVMAVKQSPVKSAYPTRGRLHTPRGRLYLHYNDALIRLPEGSPPDCRLSTTRNAMCLLGACSWERGGQRRGQRGVGRRGRGGPPAGARAPGPAPGHAQREEIPLRYLPHAAHQTTVPSPILTLTRLLPSRQPAIPLVPGGNRAGQRAAAWCTEHWLGEDSISEITSSRQPHQNDIHQLRARNIPATAYKRSALFVYFCLYPGGFFWCWE